MGEIKTMADYEDDTARGELTQAEDYKHYLSDLQEVAKTTAGARVICRLLDELGTFEPAWTDKNARLAKQVVLKDFGGSILDDLAIADADVHDDIQRMMRIRRKLAETIRASNQ